MTETASVADSTRTDGKVLACKVFHRGQPAGTPHDLSDISEVLEDGDKLVWLDAVDPGPNDLALLQEEFDLHPLAVEDAVQAHQRPRIEPYDSYWFLVVKGATLDGSRIQLHEVAIFAGRNYLVTVRHTPIYPLEEIERRWHAHPEELRQGAGFLLYTILDTVVDDYLPVADEFQERVDRMQELLFANRPLHRNLLAEIFDLKKQAQLFRLAAFPMRDILSPILRRDIDLFPEAVLAYFRDVYDHSVRVIDQLESLRDLTASALEIHLSVISTRQSEVAKQLTIIATIFLPLTFITGFFGQNFSYLVNEILPGRAVFFGLGIGTELLVLGVTLGYFKWKGWF